MTKTNDKRADEETAKAALARKRAAAALEAEVEACRWKRNTISR